VCLAHLSTKTAKSKHDASYLVIIQRLTGHPNEKKKKYSVWVAFFCDAESLSEISLQHPPGSFFLFPSQRSLSCHRCKGHLSCCAAIYSIQIKLRSHVALVLCLLSPQRSCKGLIYKPNNKLPFFDSL